MDGARQGRLTLWIGAALLVHVALIALPLAPRPDGPGPQPAVRPLLTTLIAPLTPRPAPGPTRRNHRTPHPAEAVAAPSPPETVRPEPPPSPVASTPAPRPVKRAAVAAILPPPPVEVATPVPETVRSRIATRARPLREAAAVVEADKGTPHPATAVTSATPAVSPAMTPATSAQATRTEARRGVDLEPLRKLLHAAIERHRRYPKSALRMGRQGTVGIAFTLTPEGEVRDLVTARTSGVRALDRAAERAVAAIAPFRPAGNHLQTMAHFRVDVAFRLN